MICRIDFNKILLFDDFSGPSEIAALVKENATQGLQELLGPDDPASASESAPTSFRALYGKDLVHNAIDVITDTEQVKNDIELIFGGVDKDEQSK